MNVDTLMAAMNRQKLNVPVDVSGILLVYAKDNLVNALRPQMQCVRWATMSVC